ncbi:MAG TPA: mandelate racemase/muconate lactonizing enzyme family protein [Blastocatellia bacterium]|nr:mandelate racemase/muconate lactonizing enzyme family protein [Blastocatellia bacterium]
MKITQVEARWLRCEIPESGQHISDFGRLTTFDTALVRIDTDEGISGYGEAKIAVGSAGHYAAVVTTINTELRELLIGEDPRSPVRLWEKMYSGSRAHYALQHGRVFPEVGRRGVRVSAISGVDLALWDIAGRALDVPTYRLLGGKCRDQISAYASGGWADANGIGAQLLSTISSSGYSAVKMRVGAMDGTVENSIARVKAAREAIGPDVKLMVDAHGTLDVRMARRFARGVEDCHLAWFEEPVSVDDVVGTAEVRASCDIPIAAGESFYTRFDFQPFIAARAIDIMQPDPAIAGGISEVMRIANLGSAHHLTLAPHLWGGAILFAAGMQLAAALPNCVTLEYSKGFNPLLRELVAEPVEVINGQVQIPDRPGLGVTINEDFVAKHTKE